MKNFIPLLILSISLAQKIIIPMDQSQNDHLKAYGIAYYVLKRNINVEWLLNFQGGSFLIDNHPFIQAECKIRGVTFLEVKDQILDIYSTIEKNNILYETMLDKTTQSLEKIISNTESLSKIQ